MNTRNLAIAKSGLARSLLILLVSVGCGSAAFGWNYLTPLTNLVVCPGDNATFSTVASGPTPYKFEWWKNGMVIPGKTTSSLTLSNVSASDAATYTVKLTGGYDSVTNSATLTVRTNLAITPLANIASSVGSNVVFSTVAAGTGPFTYVWQKNGVVIVGATKNTLALTNLNINDAGTYTVVVSGPCKSASSSATLSIDTCFPSVDVMLIMDRSGSMTGKPYNDVRQACSNFVANLHCITNGDQAGIASYNSTATLDQTLTNNLLVLDQAIHGIPAPGGNTSITLGLQTGQAELVSVRHNPKALPVVVLLSDGQPTGTDSPSNALYAASLAKKAGSFVFTVGIGTNVDGTLMSGIASAPGNYYFTTNTSQLTTLFNAISSVLCRPPTNIVANGPSNLTVCAGSPAVFSITASGCDSFSYQWEKNGTRLSGQTNASLTIPTVSTSDAGLYAVELSSACRSLTNSASLTVNTAAQILGPPVSRTNCPGTTAQFTISATGAGLAYQWYKNGAALNGQTATVLTLTNVGAADAATYSVVLSGTCSGFSTNSAVLVVTPLPVIGSVANKTVQLGAAWTFDAPAANYPVVVLSTVTNTANHCGNTFDATRTWVASDACGNTVTSSQTVSVVDTTAPVMTCSNTNKTVEQGSAWTFDAPTATDNSGTATISILSTVTNSASHCGTTFDATRTWLAVDGCSNSAACSQKVTVVDTTAPVITCSNTNKTVEQGSAWAFDAPAATDNSGTATISILSTVTNTASHCGTTFDATRTWLAVDGCSNSAACSQTVTVVDTTAPVITCSNTNKTVEQGSAWTFDAPTATDNSGTATIAILSTVTNTASHCGTTFDATRTWLAVDGCSNSAACSQRVTVVDTTAPVITCSNTNKTVEQGSAWAFDAPTATDNSGTATVSVLSTVTNTASHCGTTFDATRTWLAIDGCSNSAACSQRVTVVDTTAPVITCGNTNKTVEQGSAWTFDAPTATDNSGTVTITILSTVTNTVNHCGSTFDATRTWLAVDGCSNSAACSQTVTVVDTTAPLPHCSNTNKVVELGSAWTFDPPTATDNGGTNLVITILSTVTNTANHCGSTFDATRTWQVSDPCGNGAPCSQTVTIVDTTAPVIACSNTNKTVQQGSTWTFDAPTATDNSGSATIAILSTVTNTVNHCGTTFDATRTWLAVDGCSNSAACSQKVTVVDTTAPVITCSNTNKTVEQGSAWTFDAPTATDNSGTATISILSTVTNTANHCGTTLDATRTWLAVDGCSNTAACSQKVTVVDTTAPVITCSNTNKTVEQGSTWTFDAPTATDNGGRATIAILGTVTNTMNHCGTTFDATRTWLAIDGCSNSAACSQRVTVVDTTAPVITCSNTNKTVEQGSAWTFDAPTATDNSGTVTITILSTVTNTVNHCGSTFDATRTWLAVDGCSNSAACSQKVTVVDTTAPVPHCSNTNKVVELGSAWTFDPPTATDKGGTNLVITILSTVTNTANHCGTTFDATRTWQVSDPCGNGAPCSQKVTVVDTTAPVITCTNINKTVEQGSAWTFDAPTATDNSGTATISVLSTVTNTANHCGTTFDATRTWLAIDGCSNSAACSQKVTVVDTTAPVITCSNTNKTVQQGSAWTFDAPTATDSSGSVTISILSTVTNTTGHCGNTFDATRTWLAMDGCNNSAACSQKVTAIDATPIRITAPLSDQTACAETTAVFSVGATGTNLRYLWSHAGVAAGTNNSLVLNSVNTTNAGSYQVVVSDSCGDAVTNSANLAVTARTAASPLTSVEKNLGDSVVFSTVASGAGPFTYVWKKDGSALSGATTASLALTNLGYGDAALYTVEVSGACNTATQSATLTLNHPPTVSIISPTNGAIFIAPASFTVLADAQDVDGAVTNVQFFLFATNSLGLAANAPYFVLQSNLQVGSYTFTAQATDDMGARGTSAPVSITVIERPPLSVVSGLAYDPQTDFYEETVRVFNPTYSALDAVRVYIYNLTNVPAITVHNASGYTNGIPYVQTHTAIPPNSYADLLIEYYTPLRLAPNPVLVAELVAPDTGGGATVLGTGQHINRGLFLPNRNFMVEFMSISNRVYYIQYSSDLRTWDTSLPPITGNGTWIQWIDNGEPKTTSAPAVTPQRFYRLIVLP